MKFENTWVGNFEGALRGMRNPKNSWNRIDSEFGIMLDDDLTKLNDIAWNWVNFPDSDYKTESGKESLFDKYKDQLFENGILQESKGSYEVAFIGPQDMTLAQQLIKAGPEHRKFLRQIFVSVDITAPIYWWKEMDTYKVGTTANSTSTMHKLAETPITLDCFEKDDINLDLVYYSLSDHSISNPSKIYENDIEALSDLLIEQLEYLRLKYLETKDMEYWKELVRWLPESWLQKRTWTANYEVIRSICSKGQRRNHKLSEWSTGENSFIKWARTLPYAQYFIFDDEEHTFITTV